MTLPNLLRQSADGNQRLLYQRYSATHIELIDQELTEDGWEDMNVVVLDPEVVRLMLPMLVEFMETGHTMSQPTPAQLRHTVNLLFASYVRTVASIQAQWGDSPTPASAMHGVLGALHADNVDVVDSADELMCTLNQLGIFNDVDSTGHRDDQLTDDTETGFSAGVLSQE